MNVKDCIVIGAGPAGLTAGIYGVRAGLDLVVLEQLVPGGQVMKTWEVENYPGFADPVPGWELMERMEAQARRIGVAIESSEVTHVARADDGAYRVKLAAGAEYAAKTVIAAGGATLRQLGIPGEAEFTGRGVSYCATCDAAFFKNRETIVVGGGNTALEEAFYLTNFCSKVYVAHRRDRFRAEEILQKRILTHEKIVPVYCTVVEKISGDAKVNRVTMRNVATNAVSELDVDGVFIFVGFDSNSSYLPPSVLNESGEVVTDMNMKTALPGLFAAGDIRAESKRQIVTAASDGAIAALEAYEYIKDLT